MKVFLIAFLIGNAFCSSLKGQWEVINEGYAFRLIDFVSDDIGWMVTEDTILKTVDGGETWVPDPWNIGEGYRGCKNIDVLDFVNDSLGWISMYTRPLDGSGGYGLFKTVDGGKSWAICAEEKYLELEYVSEDMVILSYSAGFHRLSKSTDGGITWEDITPSEHIWGAESMSFIGSDTGVYTCEDSDAEFNRTYDGGKSWHYTSLPGFKSISEIGFIDNLNGYFVAERTSDNTFVICKTDDAFDTWTVVYENQYPVHSCYFFYKDTCIALLDDSIGCNILKSYDGGLSWFDPISFRLPGSEYHGSRHKIKFSNQSDGIIYSEDNYYGICILLKSVDSGDTWSMLNLSYPFHDVCFINDQEGFVVGGVNGATGNFGDILRTMDGGRSWKVLRSNLFAIVNCEFFNDSVGFVSNPWSGGLMHGDQFSSTNVFQTTDGGETWNEYIHTFDQFTGLKFINEYVGFALNDSGIYMTNDKGDSWDLLFSSEVRNQLIEDPSCFISTTASDENTFWTIVGDRSVIRFTSEGAWERIAFETGPDLYKIFFKDEYTGWIISGGYMAHWYDPDVRSTILKTEDGGESWFKIESQYQFRDMFFMDSLKGWVVGMDSIYQGVILQTTNGGEDWSVQVNSLSAPLNGIDNMDSILWAVGEHGLILKMNNSTNVSVIEDQNPTIDSNSYFHLYPNPTNSFLNIETLLPGKNSIEVFNMNGQLLLTTLWQGPSQRIDLSCFQKGIYIIRIRSKDFVTTRRIIKL